MDRSRIVGQDDQRTLYHSYMGLHCLGPFSGSANLVYVWNLSCEKRTRAPLVVQSVVVILDLVSYQAVAVIFVYRCHLKL